MERKTTSSSRTNTGNACRLPTGGTAARAVRTQQGLTDDLPGYARHLLHSDDEHLVRSTTTRWDKLVCTAAGPGRAGVLGPQRGDTDEAVVDLERRRGRKSERLHPGLK
jgi:hypothetical protein